MIKTVIAAIAAIQIWIPQAASLDRQQVYCMARMLWGESRGYFIDMPHIAHVAMNRARLHGRTICAVVSRPHQFNGYRKIPQPGPEWQDALQVAILAMTNMLVDDTRGATSFLSIRHDGNPSWTRNYVEIGRTADTRYLRRKTLP